MAYRTYKGIVTLIFSVFVLPSCSTGPSLAQQYVINELVEEYLPSSHSRNVFLAATAGNGALLEALKARGVSIDSPGKQGATALYIAVRVGDHQAARSLLESGANPNVILENGGAIMQQALYGRDERTLRMLLEFGADVNLKSGVIDSKPPLMYAVRLVTEPEDPSSNPLIDLLLKFGANVNASSDAGYTPVLEALRNGRFDDMYQLLLAGAKPQRDSLRDESMPSGVDRWLEHLENDNPQRPYALKAKKLLRAADT